jgi:hypothetical protein
MPAEPRQQQQLSHSTRWSLPDWLPMPYLRLAVSAVLVFSIVVGLHPGDASAQSLRGSRATVERMYSHASDNGIYFYLTSEGIRRAVQRGALVPLRPNRDYTLHAVSHPYVLPATLTFVERLASQYRQACGERLVVTSAARPRSMRLSNSVAKSVHPTGMAVDLRKPQNPRCRAWLQRTLLSLDAANVIEAIEEFRPPHFHVAVYPAPYTQYVRRRGGTVHVAAARSAGGDSYRVRSGDSLWAIAQRHGTTVERLRTANRLSSNTLRPGQELVIPGR